jgi:hypothetical protein
MTEPRARTRSFGRHSSPGNAAVERGPPPRWCRRGRRVEETGRRGFGMAEVAVAGGADPSAAASNSRELEIFRNEHRADLSA